MKINDAIFDMMQNGKVTSATTLANGAAAEDAARRIRDFPRCSFGVHLNASEWQPLTKSPALSPLLDNEKCFAGNRLREIKVDARLREALFDEWSAQIERLQSLGLQPSHIDSHHHMHTAPAVFLILKKIQVKYGIKKVRQTMNVYPLDAPASFKLATSKIVWNIALSRYMRTITTQAFTSFEIFYKRWELGAPPRTSLIELMTHPGHPGFSGENVLLAGNWNTELPVELISYNDI